MRRLAILACLCFMATSANAAGWVDPFASGGGAAQPGFSDPFGNQQAEQDKAAKEKADEKAKAKEAEKIAKKSAKDAKKKGSGASVAYPANVGNPTIDNYHKMGMEYRNRAVEEAKAAKKAMDDLIEQESLKSGKIGKGDENVRLPANVSANERKLLQQMQEYSKLIRDLNDEKNGDLLTPYGIKKGSSYLLARKEMARYADVIQKCDGEAMFYQDPRNVCVGILLHGQPARRGAADEKVTGAAIWLSKECLKDDETLNVFYQFIKDSGTMREYKDGWTSGDGIEGCLAATRKTPDNLMPRFFGQVKLDVGYDILAKALEGIGAKKVKQYRNGDEFLLDGSRLIMEYCTLGKKREIVSIAMDVGKESERVANYIDMMGIKKSLIESPTMQVRSKRGKDGRISKFEFYRPGIEAKCKSSRS